ncbi:MAG: hypothetical protein M1838_000706 [Thelocarpon superellum]|nr:MAG: hypothetical protein M1838_000706 [Thelocarpon superellum]
MDSEDGQAFIKHLAHFVRTHEKALANALQLRRQAARPTVASPVGALARHDNSPPTSPAIANLQTHSHPTTASTSSTLAAALSLPSLNFSSHSVKSAKLSLTPHHLFYLLSRFEELNIDVGPMNVRLENIHTDASPGNYVSFLSQSQRSKARASDQDSIHSVSSVRSVMSGMSSLWSNLGLSAANAAAKSEKAKAATQTDLKYLYSAFTKIPCLRLAPDRKSRLISGYEEFPFDAAVPLIAFKNISALEVCDVDFRQFFGWDRLAEQLKSLTVRRGNVDNPADLLINIVLDDMDKRRRRSSKTQHSPLLPWGVPSPTLHVAAPKKSNSAPGSPKADDKLAAEASPQSVSMARSGSEGNDPAPHPPPRTGSPVRPSSSRAGSSYGHVRSGATRKKRSGSGSSRSSSRSAMARRSGSSSNLLGSMPLPVSKWRFLRHLSLAENGLTTLSAASLAPVAENLTSLDLSSNLFAQLPDCLATLTSLRALNMSNCMIDSLHSLARNPLPAITALNLRANRLVSIAGIERLLSLERLDLRDNKVTDPTELGRLTGIPDMREIWIASNPFTRTHGGYRVTIFNLFRTAPGHMVDIIIDSTHPGYSERRQLVDRVAEPASVPVVKPPPRDASVTTTVQPKVATVKLVDGSAMSPETVRERAEPGWPEGDSPVGTNRRRKGPRRRVVELSHASSSPRTLSHSPSAGPEEAEAEAERLASPSPRTTDPAVAIPPRRSSQTHAVAPPPLDTAMAPPPMPASVSASAVPLVAKEPPDWNVSSEIYKKKIEALRNDVGNNWLAVLNEDGWDRAPPATQASPGGDFSPTSTIRPSPTTPRAGSQPIVSGARTLG